MPACIGAKACQPLPEGRGVSRRRATPGAGLRRLLRVALCAVLPVLAQTAPALPALAPKPPAAPALATHLDYSVQPGDTLIGLGRRLLVDPRQWPVLVRDNALPDSDRIRPGQVLRLPVMLLRSEPVPASVLSVNGQVRQGDSGAAVAVGTEVAEGGLLQTGEDGNATVRLVDGTVLRLRAGSQLGLRESRRYPGVGQVRSSVQLERGRIEVQSPKNNGGQPGFEVRTPQGVMGVRGTEFRVAAEAARQRTLGEVLTGAVIAEGARGAQRVGAGQGSVLDADGNVLPPVALLPGPDLALLPAVQQRPLLRFDFPSLPGAVAYRAQIARDDSFESVLAEFTMVAPPLRWPGLADGHYVLRLRAQDTHGLEGRHADHRFSLKARPEPPLLLQPAPGARLIGDVDFRWAANPEARLYWLQVARDAAFTDLVVDRPDLADPNASAERLAPGHYHWRVTSLRNPQDTGPPGDASRFELRPTPPVAAPPSSQVDDQGVRLDWPGQPGQQFDLQIARDAGFTQIETSRRLAGPGLSFEPPRSGRFHVRLRTIEADGYVGPYGSGQFFDVPHCLRTTDRACVRASGEPVLTLP